MWWSSTFSAVDRAERAQPHDQLDLFDRRARRPAGVEHRRGEVQAGRGGGHRARPVGEHRLVALGVVERRRDVRRQRHDAVAIERRQHVAAVAHDEVDQAGAVTRTGRRRPPPSGRDRRRGPCRARTRRPGRTRASQAPVAVCSRSRTSTSPPVSLCRRSRAGSTRVVFTTTTSPGRTSEGTSATVRWATGPDPSSTRSRAASRGDAGCCAIAPTGRS